MVASVLVSSLVLDIWNPFNVQCPQMQQIFLLWYILILTLELVPARIVGLLISCDSPIIQCVYKCKLIKQGSKEVREG